MRDWRTSTWGAEVSLEYGKALRDYCETEGAYRVFGSNGPVGWTSEPLTKGPGVILGRKGAYRGVRYSQEPFFVIDTAYFVVPKADLDMQWLYYAIIHHRLGEIDDGSPIPSTTRAAVYVRKLQVPSKHEQLAIAAVLRALDDKIDLNRRMNETLEAMARAVFKDWFVDFGPTRAKMDGRPPYLAPDLWALFPDRLDDKGKPEHWNIQPMKTHCCAVFNGGTPRRGNAEYWNNGNIPWLTSGEVRRPFLIGTENYITAAGFENSSAKIIPADSTVVALYGATAGQVAFVASEMTANQAVCTLIAKKDFRYYNYLVLSSSTQTLAGMARGSAQQNLSKGLIEEFRAIAAPLQVVRGFDQIVSSSFERIVANEREACTLSGMRDILLPKLMSGEIRVRDAERLMAAVA